MTPDQTLLIASWQAEEQAPFSGWDFSHLSGRMLEDQAPWSYLGRAGELLRSIPPWAALGDARATLGEARATLCDARATLGEARATLGEARAALDMGTGGGERLLSLRPDWPARMVATEDYPPNVVLAGQRLHAAGGSVVVADLSRVAPMPFRSASFDLLLNRHSGFNAAEVARILKPGGTFLTRQVHGLWAADLLAAFGATPQWPDATPETYGPALEAAGMKLLRLENWQSRLAFTDVGAIVYYLKAVPWLVPGFTVDTHLQNLLALQARLDRGEELAYAAWVYLIEAQKV
jgi:SAM-dependent methyltransferase